jgi:uncharacterized membrane protein
MQYLIDVVFRWGHILFGVTWIGLLYYFNFIQTEYVKEAEDSAKADIIKKLAPRALWWFRWAALFTFLTGLILLWFITNRLNLGITFGAVMGTIMMLNVWGIIWPNQKIVIGLSSGDKTKAAPKAALASRTNTLLSLPMLYFMVASAHGVSANGGLYTTDAVSMTGLIVGLIIIAIIQANALWGKMNGAIQSVRGVITSSIVLTVIMAFVTSIL